jgi:hypothetical protein
MKEIILRAIDWTSIKLNAVCTLGFLTPDKLTRNLVILATLSTLIYNSINIAKEIIKFKNKKS